jgi:hypothetical protein
MQFIIYRHLCFLSIVRQIIGFFREDSLGVEHQIVALATRVRFPVLPLFCLSFLLSGVKGGPLRESNPWPLAPKARIIPLDQAAFFRHSVSRWLPTHDESRERGMFCGWKPPRSRGSMVERRTPDPKVAGSSPVVVTVFFFFSCLSGSDLVVMMSALHAESRGFKPRLSYSFCENRFGQRIEPLTRYLFVGAVAKPTV